MNRRFLTWVLGWTTVAPLLAVPVYAAEGKKITTIKVRNLTNARLEEVPVTFGQAFKKGDVPRGQIVFGLVDGKPVQVEVKRCYEDRSLRFAVFSALIKEVPAGGERAIDLVALKPLVQEPPPPILIETLLQTDFDAVVTLAFPDGSVRSASARKLLRQAAANPAFWLHGPTATEWLLTGPPVDQDGKPDDDLEVQFQVRAYAGCRQVRVSVVVENCSDRWAGNIRYNAAVRVGGKEVFNARAVDHRRLARWRKVFWWGKPEPAVHLAQDLASFSAAGALPNYDRTLDLPPPHQDLKKLLRLEGPEWQIMGKGALTAYMPTTGGRMEIGPYPTWAVRYLLGGDPQERALILAQGDLAGAWPIHVRARQTGRVMKIDDRPKFWLDDRGKDRPHWQPDRHAPAASQVKLSPDLAHQPSLAYVPYLLTGDFYYLEEAYFWANYCLLATWPEPRGDAKGIIRDQIRGDAWALRNLGDAAWIAPDDDPTGAYLTEKLRSNIAHRIQAMYGPPEYNGIGAWGLRTVADARIQNPANPNWMITAPWEEDYLLWSLHHLVELGHPDAARPRDFLLRLRVGTLTHAPDFDPLLATPYRMVVGEQTADKKVIFYEDWNKLGQENARLSKPGLPNYGNSYAYSARAAVVCGIDGGFPKAGEALRWLEDHLPNHRRIMGLDPIWAIVPR